MNAVRRQDMLYAVVYVPNYYKQYQFSGYVRSISSVNDEGTFDILPLHMNFVSTVKSPITIVDERSRQLSIPASSAMVEASGNIVKIFVQF